MTTINHECYVSLEVAKLLKEAGFDWEEHYPRNFCYVNDNTELFDKSVLKNYIGEDDVIYLAPTLDVAQRWLREVKNCCTGVDVFVCNLDKNNTYYNRWFVYFNGTRYSGSNYDDTQYYEDAQEAGIKKALELILEKRA